MNQSFLNIPGLNQIIPVLVVVWWAVLIVVHVSLAVAVFQRASALDRQRGNSPLGAPIIWALATLMGGVLTVLAYWFIHHSTLSPQSSQKPESPNS